MHNADLVLFVLTDAIIGNSSRGISKSPGQKSYKAENWHRGWGWCQEWQKKATSIGGWEHLFLEEEPISSIANVKASDFADFQNWNRDAKLILNDRVWLPEKHLFL